MTWTYQLWTVTEQCSLMHLYANIWIMGTGEEACQHKLKQTKSDKFYITCPLLLQTLYAQNIPKSQTSNLMQNYIYQSCWRQRSINGYIINVTHYSTTLEHFWQFLLICFKLNPYNSAWCRYCRQKLALKKIQNTQYVACMNPTAGSFVINPRLQVSLIIIIVLFNCMILNLKGNPHIFYFRIHLIR